eukprot:SAG22_NODE_2142_length_2946_cov_22.869687_4_plen_457_part_00
MQADLFTVREELDGVRGQAGRDKHGWSDHVQQLIEARMQALGIGGGGGGGGGDHLAGGDGRTHSEAIPGQAGGGGGPGPSTSTSTSTMLGRLEGRGELATALPVELHQLEQRIEATVDRRWEALGSTLQEQLNAAGHVAKLIDDKVDKVAAELQAVEGATREQTAQALGQSERAAVAAEAAAQASREQAVEQSIALADRLAEVGSAVGSAKAMTAEAVGAAEGVRGELEAFRGEIRRGYEGSVASLQGTLAAFEAKCAEEFSQNGEARAELGRLREDGAALRREVAGQNEQATGHFEAIYCWQRLVGNPKCTAVFTELDVEGNGTIQARALRRGLVQLGEDLGDAALAALVRSDDNSLHHTGPDQWNYRFVTGLGRGQVSSKALPFCRASTAARLKALSFLAVPLLRPGRAGGQARGRAGAAGRGRGRAGAGVPAGAGGAAEGAAGAGAGGREAGG